MTTATKTKSYHDLYDYCREIDRQMAPGSNTPLWGDFLDGARRDEGIERVFCDGDTEWVSEQHDAAWREAYAAYERAEGKVKDLSTLF